MSSAHIVERFRASDAATYVGIASSTLAKLRVFGGGPKYFKLGRRVVYDRTDLDVWLADHRCSNTSEYVALKSGAVQ